MALFWCKVNVTNPPVSKFSARGLKRVDWVPHCISVGLNFWRVGRSGTHTRETGQERGQCWCNQWGCSAEERLPQPKVGIKASTAKG